MNPTLVLNMIVKNESKIITKLFDSVISIIDTYCICDTGSTDNTIDVIKTYFDNKNIKGKIITEPFQNFEYNRNIALQSCLGMSDYILLLDADMILQINNFNKSTLKYFDQFAIFQGNDTFFYQNVRIVKNNGLYNYKGVTHEYISYPNDSKGCRINRNILFVLDIGNGGCKQNKFQRDIELLKEGLLTEPNNERYHFYLANSYFDTNQFDDAIIYYKKRITLNGWIQEVWMSYYKIGLSYLRMNKIELAIFNFLEGYQILPERLEGLYEIIKYYRIHSKPILANVYYELAIKHINKNRDDYLFLQNDIYTDKLYYEYTIFSYYLGIKNINNEVLNVLNSKNKNIPNLLSNLKHYDNKLICKDVKNFDKTILYEFGEEFIKFNSSSSCLIHSEEGYMMNIRYVNYVAKQDGTYTTEKNIISINQYVELDNDLNIITKKMFDPCFDNNRYIGIDDIRIFKENNNNIKFIGNKVIKNNTSRVVIENYDINKDKLEVNCILPNFIKINCEKNWVYVNYKEETHIIYGWFPLRICKINEQNELYLVEENKMPLLFTHVRGSTCGFEYLDEIWFIQHIVSHETPRYYYHIISVFDKKMNLLRYSSPFQFEKTPIEYCLSILVENDRILINYSNWDRTTRIGIYDKTYIESLFSTNE